MPIQWIVFAMIYLTIPYFTSKPNMWLLVNTMQINWYDWYNLFYKRLTALFTTISFKDSNENCTNVYPDGIH